MFTTNYDFPRVKEVFVQGTNDLEVLATLALLPLLTKAPVQGIDTIPLERTSDATVLFLTNDVEIITECEDTAHKNFGRSHVLPLNIVPFLSKIVKEPTDLLFILSNLKSFLQDLSTNALTRGLQSISTDNTEFVTTLLLRVLWTPLLNALTTEALFINFVNENPPIEITSGFYLLNNLPLISYLERYFDLQAKALENRVVLGSPIHLLYRKDKNWFVDTLTDDKETEPNMKSYTFKNEMSMVDVITHIRAEKELATLELEQASYPILKKGE